MAPWFRPARMTPVILAALLAAGALPACASSASIEQPANQASGETRAPLAVTAHGPMKLGVEALGEVPLRADQRQTIEQMVKDAETRHQAQRKAREDLTLAVADQVQAGAIDRTALQPRIDAAAAAYEQSRPQDRADLEKLHALLTPEQRIAFVDTLRAKMEQRHHRHAGAAAGAHKGAHRGHMGMKKWAEALGLTDAQRSAIRDKFIARLQPQGGAAVAGQAGQAFAKMHEVHERLEKILDAFKTDHFVMDEVAPPVDAKQMANEFADHAIDFVQTVLPELTPAQRTIAAQKLRERASHLEEAAHPLAQ